MPGINSALGIDRPGGTELEVTNDTNLPQWWKTALQRLSYREMMFSTGCQFGFSSEAKIDSEEIQATIRPSF